MVLLVDEGCEVELVEVPAGWLAPAAGVWEVEPGLEELLVEGVVAVAPLSVLPPMLPELLPIDPMLPPCDDDVEVDGCAPVEPDAPLEAWLASDACCAAWVFGPMTPSIGPGSKPLSLSDC